MAAAAQRFAGRSVLVTGAAGGLGLALASAFATQGATLILADRDGPGLETASSLHGTADDIASLALFLASDDAWFITNEIVSCDAGNRLRGWRG